MKTWLQHATRSTLRAQTSASTVLWRLKQSSQGSAEHLPIVQSYYGQPPLKIAWYPMPMFPVVLPKDTHSTSKILYPDGDADHPQNVSRCSLYHTPSLLKTFMKEDPWKFFSVIFQADRASSNPSKNLKILDRWSTRIPHTDCKLSNDTCDLHHWRIDLTWFATHRPRIGCICATDRRTDRRADG